METKDFQKAAHYQHQPMARVHVGVTTALSYGALTDIPFSAATLNDLGCFSFAPNRYNCLEAGRYSVLFSMGLQATTLPSNNTAFFFFVAERYNSSNALIEGVRAGGLAAAIPQGAEFAGTGGGGTIDLNVGDYLRLRYFVQPNTSGYQGRFFGFSTGEWDYCHIYKLP